MRQRSHVARLFLGVLLTLSLGAFATAEDPGQPDSSGQFPAELLGMADEYLRDQIQELGLPGAQLAVVKGGQLIHLSAFGVADASGRPLTPQTPVMLASTSKSLTAVAVMQQVDAGRLALTAPVTDYLPWFRTADSSMSAMITVGHLLNHTAGFAERDGTAYHVGDDRSPQALERGVKDLSGVELVSVPGETFTYSNLNYDILGLLVQTVSGEDFGQYLQRHVFAPLDMAHSHATAEDAAGHGAAAGYYEWFGSLWQPTDMPAPVTGMPSATLYSSAEDMSHLLIAQLSGGQYAGRAIVSPQSASALLAPTVRANDFSSYAMGWFARPLWETFDASKPQGQTYAMPLVLEHTGAWANTQAFLAMVPTERLGVVLLVNGASQATPSLARAMDSNILRILHGMDPVPATVQEEPLQQYGWAVAVLLFLAELASLSLSGWMLFRWARGQWHASKPRIATLALVPLALDAAILWLVLAYVPNHFDNDLTLIIRTNPDVGMFMVPGLILAAGWGAVRTVLVCLLWYRTGRSSPQKAARPSRLRAGMR